MCGLATQTRPGRVPFVPQTFSGANEGRCRNPLPVNYGRAPWGLNWGPLWFPEIINQQNQVFMLIYWRRGRDSNPRYGCPYAAFRVRCIQPLCHLSGARLGVEFRVYLSNAEG